MLWPRKIGAKIGAKIGVKIDPHFGSGPCRKAFRFSCINDEYYRIQDIFGRGHRSQLWIQRIQSLQGMIRKKLNIPKDYLFAFVPGSTTGAMECLLWNLVGAKPVDIFSSDPFGELWRHDVINELKAKKYYDYKAPFGEMPDFKKYNAKHDCVFVYAATPTGAQVPDLNWIANNREGITICDAASAAFAYHLDWKKLDATAFSFQKALGSEAALGAIVLSPKALQRLQEFTPENRATPRLFRLKPGGKILENLFKGYLINTPSLLTLEDIRRSLAQFPDDFETVLRKNFDVIKAWVDSRTDVHFLIKDARCVSKIAPTITVDRFNTRDQYLELVRLLEEKHQAYDINGHDLVAPCIRIWCGPNVDARDLRVLVKILNQHI